MTAIERLTRSLERGLQGRVEASVFLSRFTTYRLGGPAAVFVEPAGSGDVLALSRVVCSLGDDVPVLALGRGSNLVVADRGFPGIVVHLGSGFSSIDGDGETGCIAGAGVSLPILANWAARRGLSGAEFGVAIPGSIGGAVRMNAGAHGREISDTVTSVRVVRVHAGEIDELGASDLAFSYRRSALGDPDIVVEARLGLQRDDEAAVRERMDVYRRHRAETQPGAVQNAGSVFKNPALDSAGRLVEAAGLKGFRVGGAEVSRLHANFFIAHAGATAQDVFDLVHEVRRRVFEHAGVVLEPEIRFVGQFRDPAFEDVKLTR